MSRKISYATIALTIKDAEDLISKLMSETEKEVLDYLKDNYRLIYGESSDEWKPFGESQKNISELIARDSTEEHISHTDYVSENLNLNMTELLSGVEVLFIDMFALFLDKYSLFSIKADYACDKGTRHKCCFIINSALPQGLVNKLLKKKQELWPSVSHCYTRGCRSNGIIYGINDLDNFKNNLQELSEGQGEPSAKNYEQINKTFGQSAENKTIPRLRN